LFFVRIALLNDVVDLSILVEEFVVRRIPMLDITDINSVPILAIVSVDFLVGVMTILEILTLDLKENHVRPHKE